MIYFVFWFSAKKQLYFSALKIENNNWAIKVFGWRANSQKLLPHLYIHFDLTLAIIKSIFLLGESCFGWLLGQLCNSCSTSCMGFRIWRSNGRSFTILTILWTNFVSVMALWKIIWQWCCNNQQQYCDKSKLLAEWHLQICSHWGIGLVLRFWINFWWNIWQHYLKTHSARSFWQNLLMLSTTKQNFWQNQICKPTLNNNRIGM